MKDITELEKLAKQQKQQAFYDIILTYAIKLASNKLTTPEWMEIYDFVFKFAIIDEDFETITQGNSENQYIIYDVFVRILIDFSVSMEKGQYLVFANNFIRAAAYITRFFIPSRKLKPLYEVAQDSANAAAANATSAVKDVKDVKDVNSKSI